MTLSVQISDKNKSEIMSAIRLLRGVREVKESDDEKLPIETKADYKAWKKARKELERGEAISHEALKKKYGL
ncbi:hypothetical protein [Helicobacter sp. 23-1045]